MRLTAGNMDSFAMEAEFENLEGEWIFGHFRMWCHGTAFGDWDDTVDLRGVIRWMKDLAENSRERREPSLDSVSKEEVVLRVLGPVMARSAPTSELPPIRDAFSRFVISHVGMSAFDAYDVLFLVDDNGRERIVWRKGDCPVSEAYLWPNEIERVAREFVEKATALLD